MWNTRKTARLHGQYQWCAGGRVAANALSGAFRETETVNSAAVETVIENGSVQGITVSASGESSGARLRYVRS